MSDRRRILGNMASLFTLQGANYLLPLITLPYLVRVLGPGKFGLIVFAQAFIQYFVVLANYGFNLSATREVAVHRDDPQKLGEIVSSVVTIKVLLAFAGWVLLAAIVLAISAFRKHWALYLIVYLTVVGSTLFPTWLFLGLERMRDITWMNLGARLITTAAIFIFIHNPQDYLVVAAIQSVPVLLATVPAWTVLIKAHVVTWRRPDRRAIWEQIHSGWHVFLSTAAINIYTSSNTFALGLIAGPEAVGYFSVANKIAGAVTGLYQPVNQTLYPYISKLTENSQKAVIEFIKRIYPIFVFSGLAATVVLLLSANQIITLIAGTGYAPAVPVLKWLSMLPFILAFGHIYGSLTMLPMGMKKLFSRIVTIGMLVDLVLIYPLISLYGAVGAAMSTVVVEVCVSVLMIISAKHKKLLSLSDTAPANGVGLL